MDGPALLAAILHAPNDDAPRLVYADWLDEHGEGGRAEFIRVQCQCGRGGRRERELESRLYERLTDPIVGLGVRIESIAFRRGFIEQIGMSAADWLAHADAILAAHPVTEVRLTTTPRMEHSSANGFFFLGPDEGPIFLGSLIEWNPGGYRAEVENQLKIKWPTVKTWHLPPEPVRLEARRLELGIPIVVPPEILLDNSL